MQTYTGRQFWPLDPSPHDVCIEDIAHALSRLCRFGGHTHQFYSVAEHCCLLHDTATAPSKAWALLHDASEAYIADVIRPIKPHLNGYRALEAAVMAAIYKRFGLSDIEPQEVKSLDDRIIADEAAQALGPPPAAWVQKGLPIGVTLKFWAPDRAKMEFLSRFEALNLGGGNG